MYTSSQVGTSEGVTTFVLTSLHGVAVVSVFSVQRDVLASNFRHCRCTMGCGGDR
jgi:hypothetical protein